MKLKVLGSGSKANSYILENDKEALIIEAGVPFKSVLQAINFDFDKIVGCLVSHEHKDHSGHVAEYKRRGIECFLPWEIKFEENKRVYKTLGGFGIGIFEGVHNVPCYGFYMHHKDMGNLVFATDTRYIRPVFHNMNHWLIECNYSKELLDKRVEDGFNPSLADRIVADHMSLDTCKDLFKANDLSKTRNIVLLHLSDGNSDAKQFHNEIHTLTRKSVYIADKGLEIDLNSKPF